MGVFPAFGKISRLYRPVTITEKIDGTNGLIEIVSYGVNSPGISLPGPPGVYPVAAIWDVAGISPGEQTGKAYVKLDSGEVLSVRAGSRNRWLSTVKGNDNFGFAAWVRDNAETLVKLGPGHHYGEWFGAGIQRRYGLAEKYFALFNTARYQQFVDDGHVLDTLTTVPTIFTATFSDSLIDAALDRLARGGSIISTSLGVQTFQKAEGVVIRHSQNGATFKVLLESDELPKSHVKVVPGNIKISNTGAAVSIGGIANSGLAIGVNYGTFAS